MTKREVTERRGKELEEKGFVRVVRSFIRWTIFPIIFFAGAVWFYFVIEFIEYNQFAHFLSIFCLSLSFLFSLLIYYRSLRPYLKFRRQVKKWFEDENIIGFIILTPNLYGLEPWALLKESYEDYKQFLVTLKKARAFFVTAPWLTKKWQQIVKDEITYLNKVKREMEINYKEEIIGLRLGRKAANTSIESEKKRLKNLIYHQHYLEP